MSRIVPYEKLVGDMGVSRVEAGADHVRLIWTCRHQAEPIRRHMVENVLASWLLYARWISDSDSSPREVWFEHALPEGVDIA
ncbi:AraC family transcriptional regulator ligand-binding domain-containing protein, partial [Brachybacterium paraconglomeratum]|nr:AraC family transcriptional regulator ligand-binding domain-containing protein [Brachybacterium paraconglomeratum]